MHRPHNPEPDLYPATPTAEPEGGVTVVFRDLPEAITYGDNGGRARAMAREVLELAVAERMERGGPYQPPALRGPATFWLSWILRWLPKQPARDVDLLRRRAQT